LLPVLPDADQNERAEPVIFEPDPEVDAVGPDIGEALRSEVLLAEGLVLLLPLGCQPGDRRGRETRGGRFPEQRRKGLSEVARRESAQIENRQDFRDLGRPPHVGRQDLARKAAAVSLLIDALVPDPGRRHFHRPRADRDLPRPSLAVARHEGVAALVTRVPVSLEVWLDFLLERSMQHPTSPLETERVERAGEFFVLPFGLDLDYVRHR
jgi:hypothetical protein